MDQTRKFQNCIVKLFFLFMINHIFIMKTVVVIEAFIFLLLSLVNALVIHFVKSSIEKRKWITFCSFKNNLFIFMQRF